MTSIEAKDNLEIQSEMTKHCEEQNENGELVKLSEESLMRQPEEVFDIICKLGEGSYGSVYKALHKESGQVLAIKQVPIDTDLQEIIKEISIMQQCDSLHVVKYYGSYFKDSDLWIVMEYCGAGSVSDIMRLRKKTLTEEEIATILYDTLQGLEYLHLRRKIHRDIKAGNILLNTQGHAKLADFGVAGQLSDTMAKRNTVIGTPFWMAPEVIQEIGYDCVADIWSLGITALEMAEGKPPYGDIHPMRAIFMIPTKPPPSFREPDQWQPEFIDFVSRCLVKSPEERATASELLQHDFILRAQPVTILRIMIDEAMEIRENMNTNRQSHLKNVNESDDDDVDSRTMVRYSGSSVDETLKPTNDGTLISPVDQDTLIGQGTMGTITADLGTMVINSDTEEEDSTMKRHDTAPGEPSKKYRPLFLDHFDKKEQEKKARSKGSNDNSPVDAPKIQPYIGTGRPVASMSSPSHAKMPVTPLSTVNLTTGTNTVAQDETLMHEGLPSYQDVDLETLLPPPPPYPHQQQQTQLSHQQHQQQSFQQLQQTQGPYHDQSNQFQHQNHQHLPERAISQPQKSPPQLCRPLTPEEHKHFENQLQKQLVQMSVVSPSQIPPPRGNIPDNQPKFQRSFIDGDFDFLKHLTVRELTERMSTLDREMEREIEELRQRYQAKRQPILDAMDQKRRRQQNF
ncbi:Serine/threonine-protein kinase 4 [Armadillidium nasatum]|uniref:non-specific serine/threonine protein kinase n=1 Tax=Armadillidium nasatum TaxID=96803 RepID=A0A5N5TNB6_9CRUS|nr:Serine/threonine-protein kinase 4 [Armadillidium nasatum]